MTKEEKKAKLRRFMSLYQLRLKDQDPADLPEWGTTFVPPAQEEENEEYYVVGELNFE
jgi:hypothetical protein